MYFSGKHHNTKKKGGSRAGQVHHLPATLKHSLDCGARAGTTLATVGFEHATLPRPSTISTKPMKREASERMAAGKISPTLCFDLCLFTLLLHGYAPPHPSNPVARCVTVHLLGLVSTGTLAGPHHHITSHATIPHATIPHQCASTSCTV